ncbi:MAG: hypothetical protein Q4F21_01030 [Lachnospiraceae bacterium]|nr:hypothetical protein [Lachnospiraceae bacterium]
MLFGGIVFLTGFLGLTAVTVQAEGKTFSDAVTFYEKYGNRRMVFEEGAFYYASRGKSGNPSGIRYGVEGQKFTMKLETGRNYEVGIALDDGSGIGSCRRISYVQKDSYYYSLYQVSYDSLFKRLQKKYPDMDFKALMYNHQICFQIDFYLCLVKDSESQGIVIEKKDGTVCFKGTIYESPEQILAAASWSKETKEALPHYYGIELKIYQPSNWYAVYHKNSDSASGSMKKQEFLYDTRERLNPCRFQNIITVCFEPGGGSFRGEKLKPVYTMIKNHFLGWSMTAGGKRKYRDQQEVWKLSDRHGTEIDFYALWSHEKVTFPEISRDDCEFLGWSKVKQEVLGADSSQAETDKLRCWKPGSSYVPEKDVTFYAVWKQKRYQVQFLNPDQHSDAQKVVWKYQYNKEAIGIIRELIKNCRFAGIHLNAELIRRKFA